MKLCVPNAVAIRANTAIFMFLNSRISSNSTAAIYAMNQMKKQAGNLRRSLRMQSLLPYKTPIRKSKARHIKILVNKRNFNRYASAFNRFDQF